MESNVFNKKKNNNNNNNNNNKQEEKTTTNRTATMIEGKEETPSSYLSCLNEFKQMTLVGKQASRRVHLNAYGKKPLSLLLLPSFYSFTCIIE